MKLSMNLKFQIYFYLNNQSFFYLKFLETHDSSQGAKRFGPGASS